jgi:4-hydroxybenzoate polyprenyltransferase
MNFLKKLIDFYIYSNIHVALAGFCITKITLLKFGIFTDLVPLFVGLSIIISYNFIRYLEIDTRRLGWFKKWFFQNKKWLFLLSFSAGLVLGYILYFTSFRLKSLYLLIPFGFMTLFYAIPLIKIGKLEVSFRNFPAIKIFSIAIAWAGITVLFPLNEANYLFTENVYIEFFQRILILVAITIPFDIRDINFDEKSLKTLPQLLGIRKAKLFGIVLLLLFVLLEFLKNPIFENEHLITILIAIITGLFLVFSSIKSSRYYTSFFVEAIPILWFGLIILLLKH